MSRLFLAAGVAALAISVPAAAGPGGHGGAKDRPAAQMQRGGGAMRAQAPRIQREAPARAQKVAQRRPQRAERQQARVERQQARPQRAERQQARPQRADRQQVRTERQQARPNRVERQQVRTANRQQARPNQADRVQNRQAQRQQMQAQRQQMQGTRMQQVQDRTAARQDRRITRQMAVQHNVAARQQLQGIRQMAVNDRVSALKDLQQDRFARLATAPRMQILAPAAATALVGVPIAAAATVASFSPFPQSVNYLYPSTPNYYYQYGDGYGYQIDRGSNLISALIPLLAGGYMPGSYLPASYMNSYVPNYYGLNSFYPASYGNDVCNRYMNGVVYQVDCYTGMVESVMPMYAGGYGVGQMLPASYSPYNVPMQYRSMYYNSADAGYWYSPGAIYQYDPSSSLITSVAALMTPGFTVGQRLPMGYDMYNVPMAYRATYADTPNAWYRYNNGYIYQVDPATQLVGAVVASILTYAVGFAKMTMARQWNSLVAGPFRSHNEDSDFKLGGTA
jgi:hypothetical protein